jgi:Big-like domain-containing protein
VTAYDVDGQYADSTATDGAGSYELFLEPGSYRFEFAGYDEATERDYVRKWYANQGNIFDATPVTVGDGEVHGGVNATLSFDLETVSAPQVTGTPLVNATLTATPGRWTLMKGAEFTFQWLRDGAEIPGATDPSWTVHGEDAGHKLGVRVTATVGELSGTALSAQTGTVEVSAPPVVTLPTPPTPPSPPAPAPVVKKVSSVAVAATSPKKGVARIVLTLKVAGVTSPAGKVTLKDGSQVKKTVGVLKGKAVVTLTRQRRGKHGYSAVYAGSSTVKGSTSAKLTLRVK